MTRKTIGVLMGGVSGEREVSLRSGGAIYEALAGLGYNARAIDVKDDACETIRREGIEVAFLALHGGWGEDGSIQGMLEVMGVPYTGSGVLSSALAMDKRASKDMFERHGVPVAEHVVLEKSDDRVPFDLPWAIKPLREGSSIGVWIVSDKKAAMDGLRETIGRYGSAMVERFITGKEVHIGVLSNEALGGVEVRPKGGFYSYEAKYTSGMTEYVLPPSIDAKAYERAKSAALAAHRALGCSGATRVDTIVDERGEPCVLEVNTLPGMTGTSLLPKIAAHAGISFAGLVEKILDDAVSRWQRH